MSWQFSGCKEVMSEPHLSLVIGQFPLLMWCWNERIARTRQQNDDEADDESFS
jgi:hypothetical protein